MARKQRAAARVKSARPSKQATATVASRQRHSGSDLRLHVLNAGWGDCVILELPDGGWGVVDCNCRTSDPTANHAVNFLRDRSVTRLRFVCLTHPDADHYSGLYHLIDAFDVDEFWHFHLAKNGTFKRLYSYADADYATSPPLPGNSPPPRVDAGHLRRLLAAVRDRKVRSRPVQDALDLYPPDIDAGGELPPGAVHIRALAPDAGMMQDYADKLDACFDSHGGLRRTKLGSLNHNDLSIVLLVSYGDARVLLCGDLEQRGWGLLAERYGKRAGGLAMHAVKVSHHGSVTGTIPDLWPLLAARGCPVAVLTPSVQHVLPDAEVIAEILANAETLWLCSGSSASRVLTGPDLTAAFGPIDGAALLGFIQGLQRSDSPELGICSITVTSRGNVSCGGTGAAIVWPRSPRRPT